MKTPITLHQAENDDKLFWLQDGEGNTICDFYTHVGKNPKPRPYKNAEKNARTIMENLNK